MIFSLEKQKSIIYLQIVSFCKTETDLKETLEDHLSEIKKEISLINKYLNSLNKVVVFTNSINIKLFYILEIKYWTL